MTDRFATSYKATNHNKGTKLFGLKNSHRALILASFLIWLAASQSHLAAAQSFDDRVGHSVVENCAHAVTQYELNACSAAQNNKEEQMLNNYYRDIKSRLKSDPAQEQAFTEAQRAWLSFIDKECYFRAAGGGSDRALIYSQCRNDFIKKRVADFSYYLNCPQGDIACPVPGPIMTE